MNPLLAHPHRIPPALHRAHEPHGQGQQRD
jgi:hypothetical protein